MYFKRPVCVLCLAFVLVLFLIELFFPPWTHAGRVRDSISENTHLRVSGTITRIEHREYSVNLYLKNISIISGSMLSEKLTDSDGGEDVFEGLIACLSAASSNEPLHIGSRVTLRGEFSPFEQAENEGNFDAFRYYAIRRIDGRIKKAGIEAVGESYSLIADGLYRLRERTSDVFFRYLDEKKAGTVTALILGDKTELDAEIKESYQNAGIAHILSLSGLHIAAMGLLFTTLLRRMGLKIPAAAALSGVVMLLYSIMTGLSTSTVRALIMFVMGIAAMSLKRTYDLLSAAALSAVLMLLENPWYLYDSGFLLSFSAVMGISLINPILMNIREEAVKNRLLIGLHNSKSRPAVFLRGLADSVLFSLSIQTATLPVTQYCFFQVPLFGILLNLLVIPLMSIVLGAGVILAIAGNIAPEITGISGAHALFDVTAYMASRVTAVILGLYDRLAGIAAGSGGALYICGKPGHFQILVYAVLIILLIVLFSFLQSKLKRCRLHGDEADGWNAEGLKKRFAVFSFVMIALATTVLCVRRHAPVEFHAVSVGQGDSMLIFGRDTPVILIDGGATDIKNIGKYRLIPCLKAYGIASIDYVFISHFDADHVNGIIELLEDENCGISIKRLIISSAVPLMEEMKKNENYLKFLKAASKRIPVLLMDAGDTIETGEVCITALAPDTKGEQYRNRDLNDNSLVLHLLSKKTGITALFTGDMSAEVEKGLIDELGRGKESLKVLNEPVTILKVAHHGSRTGSSEEFTDLLSPEISTISCGRDNSYGHPHKEALQSLSKVEGNHIFITAECGEIIIKADENGISVSSRFK